MTKDFNTEILGDCFVHNIHVDFILKQTKLILGGHPSDSSKVKHELIFSNVVWQEFNGINSDNIFWGMEVADNFEDFKEREKDYLVKMKNYFPAGLLEMIKENTALKYYFIIPTTGLGGFVICNDAALKNL